MSADNERIANAIAAQLPGGRVQHDSQKVFEWRGPLYNLRSQIRFEAGYCVVKVEAQNPLGTFTLMWGPRFVPDPGAVDNDAFDSTDEVRVWVGRNVVIECFALELPEQITGFRSFPPQATYALVECMQRDRVSVLGVEKSDLTAYVEREQPDVVGATVRCAQLLGWFGAQLPTVAPTAAQAVAAAAAEAASPNLRVRCRYCAAKFLISQSGRCPSCGAPAS